MNLLFLSGTHPAARHISGVRAARFVNELARRGHRCVLLCPALAEADDDGAELGRALATHDWSRPLILTVVDPVPGAARSRFRTAFEILRVGGMRAAFSLALAEKGRAVCTRFQPDAVWATYGTLESVYVAAALGPPWMFDVKDNPETYLPPALWRAVAWRLRGFSALSANSVLHAAAAERWLGRAAAVIYSGVDDCFEQRHESPEPAAGPYVTLVGGLYDRAKLDAFVDGVALHNRGGHATLLTIRHFGAQGALLAESAARHADHAPVIDCGYVQPGEMAAWCQWSIANAYIFHGATFHHKLLELLACGRPVLAVGGELEESFALARSGDGLLQTAGDADSIEERLAKAMSAPYRRFINDFGWARQAETLETLLMGIARHG